MQLDILTRIKLLSQQLDRTFTAATDAKLPNVAVGQKVIAEVAAKLPDGSFKVLIGNQPLQMNLPQTTQAGAKVELTLVAREPRLTFSLAQPQAEGPKTSLSDGARLLSTLRNPSGEPAAPLTSSKPVLPSPPFDVKQLATALQTTLSQSGLFYESHQAQWVSGSRPLAEILHEPQGKLSPIAQPAAEGATKPAQNPAPTETAAPKAGLTTAQAAQPASTPQTQATPEKPPLVFDKPAMPVDVKAAAANSPATTHAVAAADIGQAATAKEAVHAEMLPIVRQQLDALDSRQFNWSGQIWPGQTMDWQIDEEGGGHGASDAKRNWQSRLHLVLPNLGDVTATLQLGQAGVQISIKAADAETQNKLRDGIKLLHQSLQDTGIQMLSMKVGPDGA